MKKLTVATTAVLGLICVAGVAVAQDQTQTTEMQNVTVTGVPATYETYAADLQTGYQLRALVGSTRKHYLQAQRAADTSEALRRQGISMQPVVAVAIDNSAGPGVARRYQLINAARETVAIVDMYCKRVVPAGSPRCHMAPRLTGGDGSAERLASIPMAQLQVAEVSP